MKRIISLFLSMVVVLSLSFSTVALAAETPATMLMCHKVTHRQQPTIPQQQRVAC